jgi:hypothetical protein
MISIGGGARFGAGPEDLAQLLLACHQRIRSFSALALRIGSEEGLGAVELREGCERVARYFTEALPLHVKDEEEGLIPQLRGREPELDRALEQMASDTAARALAGRAAARLAGRPLGAGRGAPRTQLARVAALLGPELERHLDQEERLIFPAIPRLLSFDAQQQLILELRARRR